MKIEWDEPRVPKRNVDSMWTKVKNSISVLKQTHDGPPPRSPARSNSYGTSSHSRSRSTSSHPHSSSSSGTHTQRSRSAGPSSSPRPARPYVTIATNGGPPQAIQSSGGQYGSAYVVQSSSPYPVMEGVGSPVIYGSPSSPSSPMYYSSSSPLGARPKAVHRATAPQHASSPLRTPTSGAYTPPSRSRPAVPSRTSTSPGDPNGGVMYNGKLIVGDPNEVNRYISSQKGIEKWLSNVK